MSGFLFFINVLAIALVLIGSVRIVFEAFSVSRPWGFACLFLPAVAIFIFVALNWQETKKPFIALALGIAIFVGSTFLVR